jgi:hypothetical protein
VSDRVIVLRCEHCREMVQADVGLFGHAVVRAHRLSRQAYHLRHPRARLPWSMVEPVFCDGSDRVIYDAVGARG